MNRFDYQEKEKDLPKIKRKLNQKAIKSKTFTNFDEKINDIQNNNEKAIET